VHRVLRHLEHAGFAGAPRFLGSDGRTERLSFIPGAAGAAGWPFAVPDRGLWQMSQLLRRYHDAVADFVSQHNDEWSSGTTHGGGSASILHGDPGPWNMVWSPDGTPVALIDWDHANPGEPLDDLAYLAAYAAPLAADDAEAMTWMKHRGPPDRVHRLDVLADGYGTSTDGLVDRAIEVMAKTNRTVERLARLGLEPQRTWVAEIKLARLWDRHAHMVAHRSEFL
jgi:hypothetical protein